MSDMVYEKEYNLRAWCLKWTPNVWELEKFEEMINRTNLGYGCTLYWRDSKMDAQIGDRVFWIKLDEEPKGIFASGYIVNIECSNNEDSETKIFEILMTGIIDYRTQPIIYYDKLKKCFNGKYLNIKNKADFIDLGTSYRLLKLWKLIEKESKITDEQYDELSWFPAPEQYNPHLSVEDMVNLLKDPKIFDKNSLEMLETMYNNGGMASCAWLANKLGNNFMYYNNIFTYTARRVAKKMKLPSFPKELSKDAKYWAMFYQGRYTEDEELGSYKYKMRTELKEAFEIVNGIKPPILHLDSYSKGDFLRDVYVTASDYNMLSSLLINKKNIILQGVPGVGKTFSAKRLAYCIMGKKDDSRIEFVQFHQNYSYEDFIMGYRPNENGGFDLKEGIFYKFCKKAEEDSTRDYFFIIDEINRGNMSKIFGELLMMIEKDYRGQEITLAYNGEKFSVPQNLYIIGMMNTADRSIAIIDYALRRRFSFFEINPKFESEGFTDYQKGLNNAMFDNLINQVKSLNHVIEMDLGKGFLIGHSYFCNLKEQDCTIERLRSIVDYDILPMLSEYWFDDEDKVETWRANLHNALGVKNDE